MHNPLTVLVVVFTGIGALDLIFDGHLSVGPAVIGGLGAAVGMSLVSAFRGGPPHPPAS